MTSATPTLESLRSEPATFSSLYVSLDAAAYASQVDDETLMADFEAASKSFTTDESKQDTCAHALPAFLMEVRRSDEKINAALGKKPAVIGRLIQSEAIKAAFETREKIHNCIKRS